MPAKMLDLYNECCSRIGDKSDDKTCEVSDTSEEETDPEPCDSVSQVDSRYSATSSKSSVVKRIELQKKRAELDNMQELAKAKARKMRKLAEAEADEAEALAKVRLEMVNIEARNSCLLVLKVGLQLLLHLKPLKLNLCFDDELARKISQNQIPLIV